MVLDYFEPTQSENVTGWTLTPDGKYLLMPSRLRRCVEAFLVADGGFPSSSDFGLRDTSWEPIAVETLPGGPSGEPWVAIVDTNAVVYWSRWDKFLWRNVEGSTTPDKSLVPVTGRQFKLGSVRGATRGGWLAVGGTAGAPAGGSVQLYRCDGDGLHNGQTAKEIEEAPYDVALDDAYLYVATGRGRSVEVRSLATPSVVENAFVSSARWYKPVRLALDPERRRLWIVSYDRLFWAQLPPAGIVNGPIEVAPDGDCIGHIVVHQTGRVIASCLYSHQLRVIDEATFTVSYLDIEDKPLLPPVHLPARLKTSGDLIFVSGLGSSKTWILQLQS